MHAGQEPAGLVGARLIRVDLEHEWTSSKGPGVQLRVILQRGIEEHASAMSAGASHGSTNADSGTRTDMELWVVLTGDDATPERVGSIQAAIGAAVVQATTLHTMGLDTGDRQWTGEVTFDDGTVLDGNLATLADDARVTTQPESSWIYAGPAPSQAPGARADYRREHKEP